MKDLTVSKIERQNILNNHFAITVIQEKMGIEALLFENQYWLTKKMVADFYGVEERTIERYIAQNEEELKYNGYILCKGKFLKEIKLQFAPVINVGSKTTQLSLFNFRAFLNIGMLLTESDRAKELRSMILDIVISSINEKNGGGIKFINRRDVNFLPIVLKEANYRKQLTSALRAYVNGHETNMYSQVTNAMSKGQS